MREKVHHHQAGQRCAAADIGQAGDAAYVASILALPGPLILVGHSYAAR